MSFTITDAFVQQFSGNVRLLAQQQNSRLRSAVIEETITGEAAYLEQVAPTAARKKQARHQPTAIMNTQHLRRRIAPYEYDWGDIVDREDKARMLIDPVSTYARNAGYAMSRAFDDEIIGAFFANAYTGHSGGTTVTWPNGNAESTPTMPAGLQVGVADWSFGNGAGNAGLTISKLISAKMQLLTGEGDPDEEAYIALGAKQIGNLLNTTEVTSNDYAAAQALQEGKIGRFMGFNVIHSERLTQNGSGYTRVPAWRKSAVGIGIARDIEGQIGVDPGRSFSTIVYADESIGAARLEEVKLVELICL